MQFENRNTFRTVCAMLSFLLLFASISGVWLNDEQIRSEKKFELGNQIKSHFLLFDSEASFRFNYELDELPIDHVTDSEQVDSWPGGVLRMKCESTHHRACELIFENALFVSLSTSYNFLFVKSSKLHMLQLNKFVKVVFSPPNSPFPHFVAKGEQ